jgi:hypothetical protein
MNDALKLASRELTLKLNWPSDQTHLAGGQRVVMELQDANGLTMASLSVPNDQLLQAVSQKLECYPLMMLDGVVSIASDETVEPLPANQTITLDQLIAEGISADMLEDEKNVADMLSELRARLLKSLEHVEQAIASLPKD